jgi:hypothetical protein
MEKKQNPRPRLFSYQANIKWKSGKTSITATHAKNSKLIIIHIWRAASSFHIHNQERAGGKTFNDFLLFFHLAKDVWWTERVATLGLNF